MADLTPAEVEALRAIIPHINELKAEAEYRAARRLLITSWRQSVILLAAFVTAMLMLREQLKGFVVWLGK